MEHEHAPALCTARGGRLVWLAEFTGAAGLLLVAIVATRLTAPGGLLGGAEQLPAGRALVIGLAISAELGLFALTPLGRCSGAHLNPAVSLLLWREHALSSRALLRYVGAQLAGSFAGVAVAALVLGAAASEPDVAYGVIRPGPGWGAPAAAAAEFTMTVLLLVVITAMRHPALKRLGPLPASVVVVGLIWGGSRLSGAGFNPIRNLAPAAFDDRWSFQAAYLLAPLAASVFVAAVISLAPRPVRSPHAEPV